MYTNCTIILSYDAITPCTKHPGCLLSTSPSPCMARKWCWRDEKMRLFGSSLASRACRREPLAWNGQRNADRVANRVSNLQHSSDSSVNVCQDHQPQTTKINTAVKNGAAAFAMLTTRFRSDLGQGGQGSAWLSMAQHGSAPCLRHLRASSVPAWQILWCFRDCYSDYFSVFW